jgi:hypothetical protein
MTVVGRLVQNRKETAQKEKQHAKQHKITEYIKEITNINNKTNIKRTLENISRVIRK